MPMDLDDQRYFDGKFGEVHKRITDSEKTQTSELHRVTEDQNKKITEIRSAIDSHKVESGSHPGHAIQVASEAARIAIEDHEKESWVHNPTKALAVLVALSSLAGTVGAIVGWVMKHLLALPIAH